MLDRIQRLRRGAVIPSARAAWPSCSRAAASDTGRTTARTRCGPAGPRRAEDPRPDHARSSGSRSSSASAWSAATIYVALRFREKPGEERSPKQMHGNTALEISWTIVPALILAVMAVLTVADDLRPRREAHRNRRHPRHGRRRASGGGSTTYPDKGVESYRQRDAHPDQPPVYLTLRPPMHGAVLRRRCHPLVLGARSCNGKKDVVPGQHAHLTIEADQPGTFLGQCAEYCGLSHADMRLRVIAADARPTTSLGREQQRARRTAKVASSTGRRLKRSGAARRCHSFEPEDRRARRRPEPHAPRRPHRVRRRHLPDEPRRTCRTGSTTRPVASPMGNLAGSTDAGVQGRGHDARTQAQADRAASC